MQSTPQLRGFMQIFIIIIISHFISRSEFDLVIIIRFLVFKVELETYSPTMKGKQNLILLPY